jgi:hypothetical protein
MSNRENVRMRETPTELDQLQSLIDRSHARIGTHMGNITDPDQYALNAQQVVRLLDGMHTVAVAAPAPNGDPLVAPMDGWFLHGRFYFSSAGNSIRIRGLRKRPRASIAFFDGERFLVNAHGPVVLLEQGNPDVAEIDEVFRKHYGESAFEWGEGTLYVRLDADRFFTYSRTPEDFPA